MGLERRGSGLYFYQKERRGKRVVSVYCGSGEVARLMQVLYRDRQDEARFEREARRESFEKLKASQAEIDAVIEAFSEEAKALEDALYLVNGYHIHSRQWRRKRNGDEAKPEERGND